MAKSKKPSKPMEDPDREERISNEIIVDAYDEEERSMGWYYYLQDQLSFPFPAKCIAERATSPLSLGDKVEVVGMADADECSREMFVEILREERKLAVPLAQLKVISGGDETKEAVEDWHYWVGMGHEF